MNPKGWQGELDCRLRLVTSSATYLGANITPYLLPMVGAAD
jgi:hypothetical protein